MSWVTVQLGLLFNSGWPFEMSNSAALTDPRESKALNILILIQSASCQTWALLYLWSLEAGLCSELTQRNILPGGRRGV